MITPLIGKEELGGQEVDMFLTRSKVLCELIKKRESRYSTCSYRATEEEEQCRGSTCRNV